MLILSLRYQSRWREALGLLQESLASLSATDRASTTGRALRNMEALVHLEAGQPLRAAAVWDSLVRHAPPGLAAGPPAARYYTQGYTLLATALAAANDTTRLAAAVEAAAGWSGKSINRRDAGLADHARGLLLIAGGDTTGAIAAFARALYSRTSGFTRTNRDLAALTLESGSLWVTHTELHDLLARAYHATGMTDSARVHYQYVASALAGSDAGVRDRYEGAKRWLERKPRPGERARVRGPDVSEVLCVPPGRAIIATRLPVASMRRLQEMPFIPPQRRAMTSARAGSLRKARPYRGSLPPLAGALPANCRPEPWRFYAIASLSAPCARGSGTRRLRRPGFAASVGA